MLADDLLEDARFLAQKGGEEKRQSCSRRAISTAYYALFHLLVDDFVEHWEFKDERARLGRMFNHQKMRDAGFAPKDPQKLTQTEASLVEVKTAFAQLQRDRHRADYDLDWDPAATDVLDAITREKKPSKPGDPFDRMPPPDTTYLLCLALLASRAPF